MFFRILESSDPLDLAKLNSFRLRVLQTQGNITLLFGLSEVRYIAKPFNGLTLSCVRPPATRLVNS